MKPSPRTAWILFGLAAVTAGAMAGAMFFSHSPTPTQAATLLQAPRPVADFQLLDPQGRRVGTESLRGQWNVVFAGFTNCAYICPTTLSLLNQVVTAMGTDQAPQVVLLSVDPERDTPQRMKTYLAQFNPHFTGLTGDAAQLASLRSNLGLVAAKMSGPASNTYTVDHSAALVIINPQGEIAGYFSPPFNASALSDDLRQLTRGS